MDENEFKKLASNSRDWLIYQLLSERSKEVVKKELTSEHVSGVDLEKEIGVNIDVIEALLPEAVNPKGETTVKETVTGKVVLITDLAVLIGNADRVAWFPKSVILNLDKIALKQGEQVELKIVKWFKYKIEWKVPTQ